MLKSIGSQIVRHDLATEQQQQYIILYIYMYIYIYIVADLHGLATHLRFWK